LSIGGTVITDFGSLSAVARSVALQADGKIVVTGYTQNSQQGGDFHSQLVRYNADGSIDTAFATGGIASSGPSAATGSGVAIQADGKIVAAGGAFGNTDDFAVARYNSDGSLDLSFGIGGKVTTRFGTSGSYGVVIQGDGKIVLAGGSDSDIAVARYNTDGSLDSSFGGGGEVTTNFSSSISSRAYALVGQPDGKVIVAGIADNHTARDDDFAVVRYNNDGSLDASFGSGGKVTTDFSSTGNIAHAVTLQADGKILVAGLADSDANAALARYNSDGSLDATFGTGGRVTTDFGGTQLDTIESVKVQSDGKIVVAGFTLLSNPFGVDLVVARYNSNGSLDNSFGSGGKVLTSFGANQEEATSLVIQPDGKIVVAGVSGGDYALARYNSDGSLDTSFGAGLVSINDISISEGNSGTKVATFTVTRTGGSAAFDVNFATADSSATAADADYVAAAGTLHFAAGVNTQTISVTINGDTKVESNENFLVNLSAATNGATFSDGQGVGTIADDDNPTGSVTIGDAVVSEGNSGTKIETFTVTRSGGTAAFNVDFATSDGSATVADHDYVATAGTLHFNANVNTQTISVVINGDTKPEHTEAFLVSLSGATNSGVVTDSQGVGTITNDEVASHDFNGDGKSDIFLQHANGSTLIWEMNGINLAASGPGPTTDPSVHAVGIGDLDGDGKGDIVLQNSSGGTYLWEMDGFNLKSAAAGPTASPAVHVVGTGDFDGDGKSDIVLQDTSGDTFFWLMDGFNLKAAAAGPTTDPAIHVVGTGDIDGDGKTDIILQNTNGATYLWEMDGFTVKSQAAAPVTSPAVHIVGTGDIDGDGRSDIILQNTAGATYFWEMDGINVKSQAAGPITNPAIHVVATGDIDGDGKSDIILQNTAAGATYFWEMDGLNVKVQAAGPAPDHDWHIV
jgi:uncharacterized delta-60 repeat protein